MFGASFTISGIQPSMSISLTPVLLRSATNVDPARE